MIGAPRMSVWSRPSGTMPARSARACASGLLKSNEIAVPRVTSQSPRQLSSTEPGRSCEALAAPGWTGTPPPGGYDGSPRTLGSGCLGCIRTCSATPSSPPCSTPGSTCVTYTSPPGTPTHAPPWIRPGPQEPGPAPELHTRRPHGLRNPNHGTCSTYVVHSCCAV
jgi:hypothetical protein